MKLISAIRPFGPEVLTSFQRIWHRMEVADRLLCCCPNCASGRTDQELYMKLNLYCMIRYNGEKRGRCELHCNSSRANSVPHIRGTFKQFAMRVFSHQDSTRACTDTSPWTSDSCEYKLARIIDEKPQLCVWTGAAWCMLEDDSPNTTTCQTSFLQRHGRELWPDSN